MSSPSSASSGSNPRLKEPKYSPRGTLPMANSSTAAAQTLGVDHSRSSPVPISVSIDLEEYASSSSSVTDVCDEDWQSVRRLSAPAGDANARSFSRNPIAYVRSIMHNRHRVRRTHQDGVELDHYYKSNHPVLKQQIEDEKRDFHSSSPTMNGRRKLSMAFLQDMVPMEAEESTPMGVFMGSHLERALRLSHAQSSKITLGFLNGDVEIDYRSYFWVTMRKRWILFTGIAGALAISVQVAGLLGNNGDGLLGGATASDWGVLAGVAVVPILLISALPYLLKEVTMARYVHFISLAFLLIIGPVMTCVRYTNKHFVSADSVNSFNPSVTAPIYIVGLIASVFFLRLRFVHTLVATMVAAPTWYAVLYRTATDAAEMNAFILNSIVLFFACFVTCFIAFDLERSLRHQYLSNSRFLTITKNLQSQLDGLERSLLYSASKNGIPTADLSSPLERAMLAIRGLMADAMMPAEHLGVLELIMACLSSPNLLTPDLDVQVKEGNVAIDDEQEKWLFNEVATRSASRGAEAGLEQIAQFETFKFGDSEYEAGGDSLSLVEVDVNARRPSAAPSTFYAPTAVISVESLDSIFNSHETRGLLYRVPEYNFPIFELNRITDNHPLLVLGHHLVEESGLLRRLGLDSFKFNNFLATIEGGYHTDLPYHNSIHAADVLHCINFMVSLPTIRSIFTDLEILAIYIAASIHDFDHPGVNNSYLIATADRRALLYNDKAVLENHHCASAFEVLARKECAFLSTLDRADYKSLRENVVDMVLATDLAQHFTHLTNFKKKVLTGDTFDPLGTREDRTLLMQMLMKCSDVSNPTKAWPEYSMWIERIHQEWYRQGDMEKARGLPYSPFCNRDGPHATNPASSQTGFINFIVSPLFEAFSAWTPIDEIWQGLERNKERWAEASGEPPAKKVKPAPLVMPTSPKLSFRTPMRLQSMSNMFSPTSPTVQKYSNSMVNSVTSPKLKLARSKSTTHTPVYLSAVASNSSLAPLVPDGELRLGRRGSDSRDPTK